MQAEPDLDDFLSWNGGTLEYWLHILVSSVGRRMGWASTTEVPYNTERPAGATKTKTKWADGAIMLPGRVGVLVEVKTVSAHDSGLGATIKKVPADFAALVAVNWPQTLEQRSDKYSGPPWVDQRAEMTSVYGLQLVLAHGQLDMATIDDAVRAGMSAGIATLAYPYRHADEPPWLALVRERLLGGELNRRVISGGQANAVLYSWITPIARR